MRLVAAELLKVWTAPRVLLGILLSELAIVLIGTIATLHSAVNDPVLPPHLSRDIATMGGIALLFTTLVGILIATTEYRHGTITLTFLATPVREKVLAAKTGAAVIASDARSSVTLRRPSTRDTWAITWMASPIASRVLRCGRPTFAVRTQCASRVRACSAEFAWMVLRLPRWPVFSACSRSNASGPRTSPTRIRSGRCLSAARRRSDIVTAGSGASCPSGVCARRASSRITFGFVR